MGLSEESKGLWANIRAKRARGEKPARKGSEAHKKAVAAAKRINAQNEEVVDNQTPSSDMEYQKVMKAMAQDSMYEDEPAQTTTTGSTTAMPMGFYETTICNRCAIALLEDIKSGKFVSFDGTQGAFAQEQTGGLGNHGTSSFTYQFLVHKKTLRKSVASDLYFITKGK